jgi:Na+/phosphate symporter
LRAIDKESGREILLVQTLRNSLMGASVIASTSLVAIIGVVSFGRSLALPIAAVAHGTPAVTDAFRYAHWMVNFASAILVIALTEALLSMRTLSRAGFGAAVGISGQRSQDDELGNAEKYARYLASALRQLSRSALWLSAGMAMAVAGGIILAW